MSKTSNVLAALGVVAALGVAALPLSTYAIDPIDSKAVPVSLTIEPILQISTSAETYKEEDGGQVFDKMEPVILSTDNADGTAEYASKDFTVKVKTNNSKGYTISMMGTDGKTDLVSGTDTISTGTLAAGSSAWAFKVTPGAGTSTQSAWTAVPATSTVIYTGTQTAGGINVKDGIDTPVDFGATIDSTQAAGTYTGSVTFTATALTE